MTITKLSTRMEHSTNFQGWCWVTADVIIDGVPFTCTTMWRHDFFEADIKPSEGLALFLQGIRERYSQFRANALVKP